MRPTCDWRIEEFVRCAKKSVGEFYWNVKGEVDGVCQEHLAAAVEQCFYPYDSTGQQFKTILINAAKQIKETVVVE